MNYRDIDERKQMLRSSSAPETVIVGKQWYRVCFSSPKKKQEQDKTKKSPALALAGHPIEKSGRFRVGEDLIETFGEYTVHEVKHLWLKGLKSRHLLLKWVA